jgi:hypothetical protein
MKRFMVLFAALVISATFTLTNEAGPKGSGPGKGGTKPPPSHTTPTHTKPGHPGHPGHMHPGPNRPSGTYVAPAGDALPWQTVRYLRVSNQSGVTLTIFGQLAKDGPTYNWTVNPDVTTFLAIDGQKIAEAQVYLWARSGDKNWMSARDGLTLVNEAYQANDVGVFTYTFNP